MKQLYICFILLLCYSVNILRGQMLIADSTNKTKLLWTATISGGINLNQHKTDMSGLPGVPSCCPNYSSGSGNGIAFGGKFALPISSTMFAEFKLGFSALNGTMKALQTQLIDNNGVAEGIFEHTITSKINELTFEPTASILLWKTLQLHGGLSIGAITSATFTQSETLLSPSDVVFENNTRSRNQITGDISQIQSLQAALTAGISYSIPISSDGVFSLTPEIAYYYGLTNAISTNNLWKINSIRMNLGLTYNFLKLPPLGTGIQLETPPENRIPSKR